MIANSACVIPMTIFLQQSDRNSAGINSGFWSTKNTTILEKNAFCFFQKAKKINWNENINNIDLGGENYGPGGHYVFVGMNHETKIEICTHSL